MFLCFLAKWTITIFALSLPSPAGVVAPTMVIGGLLGQCFGLIMPESLHDFLLTTPDGSPLTDEMRGAFIARFAILGAAAFCSAVCRAFAMAITVYEVLAIPSALLPLCAASISAIFVADKIALPYFDTNLVGRGLGGISALTHTSKASDPAFNVMRRMDLETECLELITTVGQCRRVLAESRDEHVPIVQQVNQHWSDTSVTLVLKGSMSRTDLMELVSTYSERESNFEIDLGNPDLARPSDGSAPLVTCIPTSVNGDTHVQDVYLVMKITGATVIYVIEDNCLLGIIRFKELLGHQL